MAKKHRKVWADVATVGQNFGCVGVIRDCKTHRIVGKTRLFPNGFTGPAYNAAIDIILSKNTWELV